MNVAPSPLSKVLREVFGSVSSGEEAILLCNLLYLSQFQIRLPSGELFEESPSMREASQLVEAIFTGHREGLHDMVSPGYEYAYWLHYFNGFVSEEQWPLIEALERRIKAHPDVLGIRRDEP